MMKRSLIMMSVTMAVICFIGFYMCQEDKTYSLKSYIVQQGDTLWSVVSNESDISGDIREVVYDTYNLNNISQNEDIYPGQVILIPVGSRR